MLLDQYDCHERIDSLGLSREYIAASNLERRGWVIRNIPNPETVAQHQISSALLVSGRFRKDIENLGIDITVLQDTLLIHDIAEPDKRVGDITPHCGVSPQEKREREELVIREILKNNPYLLKIWFDYEDERTPEGRLGKEIDKLQAILKAGEYEDTHQRHGIVEEFYTYSILKKNQINTRFLLDTANTVVYRNQQTPISVAALQENLQQVPRIWTKDIHISHNENVSEHVQECINLVKRFTPIIYKYGGNPLRVIHLLEVHDIPEILTGDTDPRRIDAHVKHVREEWAMTLLISNPDDRDAWHEYAAGESIDAQFAKAFDKMQFLLKLQKIGWRSEYPGAMRNYRKYFLPFPELLNIVDHPMFSTTASSENTTR